MTYPVLTGKADKTRLSILNKIYNPISINFLQNTGLQTGAKVLEIGCGYGDMAFWLANHIGQSGEVIAIDQSEEQIKIAKKKLNKLGIKNLNFLHMPLTDLPSEFYNSFDFAYTRWALMFVKQPLDGIEIIFKSLKKGGTLVCEDVSGISNGIFTCPKSNVGERWTNIVVKNFQSLNLHTDLAGYLYNMFTQIGFKSINAQLYQPMLKTKVEKSIFRLGVLSTSKSIIENKAATKIEIDELVQDLEKFENCNRSIIGYMRNLLISGKK